MKPTLGRRRTETKSGGSGNTKGRSHALEDEGSMAVNSSTNGRWAYIASWQKTLLSEVWAFSPRRLWNKACIRLSSLLNPQSEQTLDPLSEPPRRVQCMALLQESGYVEEEGWFSPRTCIRTTEDSDWRPSPFTGHWGLGKFTSIWDLALSFTSSYLGAEVHFPSSLDYSIKQDCQFNNFREIILPHRPSRTSTFCPYG